MSRKTRKKDIFFLLILLSGIFARVFLFGQVPDGLNQDEAFAGYEAWNILTTHHDTMGYRLPLYLFTNGGGMNALETYLMIPFIVLFGPQDWVIRIPQALIAILSLPAMYGTAKRIFNEKVAIWAMLLLAWSPWHIMMSRWGLESNLAPGMLLFALYFFLRGVEDKKFFLVSALIYGLSLYSYAVIWPYVPLMLLFQIAYLIACGKISIRSRVIYICAGIVAIMAIPLLLVVFVNYGLIGEINSRFFSIPKLDFLRTNQTSGYSIKENVQNLLHIVFFQSDGLIWNSPERFGLYYPFGILFILIGIVTTVQSFFAKWRKKEYATEIFILIPFFCGLILGITSHVNVNRINIIFIPLLMMGGNGVIQLVLFLNKKLHKIRRWPVVGIAALYFVTFLCFEHYYFTDYRMESAAAFDAGLKDALQVAEQSGKTIHINKSGIYPKVLYYLQIPVEDYMETRVFSDWHPMPKSTENLYFDMETAVPDKNGVFILQDGFDLSPFVEAGFEVIHYKSCYYAYYPE